MVDRTAACGCPFDGIFCPHCGRGQRREHVLRCHVAAIGYPVAPGDVSQPAVEVPGD